MRWAGPWVLVAGGAAAWAAAGFAVFMPALWIYLLLACLALRPDERRLLAPGWLAVGLLLLTISWVVALDHELACQHSLLFLAAALLFGLARLRPASEAALGVLALAIAAASVTVFVQAARGFAGAQDLLGELAPALREAAAARLSGGRPFGTTSLPGHFACLLVLVTPLLIERGVRSRGWARAAWWSSVVPVAAAVVLTRSLAALGVAAVVGLIALTRRRRVEMLIGGGVTLGALVTAAVMLRGDMSTLEPLHLRWINWMTAVSAFASHPLLGVGLGGIGQAGLTAPTAAANITPYAHNTYLQLLAELGLAGLGLVVAGVAALVRVVGRGLSVAPALALAVAVVPLHNLVDFSAYMPEVLLPWAVLLGTLVGRLDAAPPRPLSSRVLVPLLAGGVLLSTLAWRGEVDLTSAAARSGDDSASRALAAARFTPWEITPLLVAADQVWTATLSRPLLLRLDRALAERAWVRPCSSSWAEARARVLLALGRRGEARVWVREARRRAPWRTELTRLERACVVPR